MNGAEQAAVVRAIMGGRPATAEIVCARFRVPVYRVNLAGRLRAVYVDGAIGVRIGLTRPVQQHLILHELAHHLMHADIAAARFSLDRRGATLSRLEREAEEFAYYFAISDAEMGRLVEMGWDGAQVAAHYCRTPAWVQMRAMMPVATY